jgi:hypothetical protein
MLSCFPPFLRDLAFSFASPTVTEPCSMEVVNALGFFNASTLQSLTLLTLSPTDPLGFLALGQLRELRLLEVEDAHHNGFEHFIDPAVSWILPHLIDLTWRSAHYEILHQSSFPRLQYLQLDVATLRYEEDAQHLETFFSRIAVLKRVLFFHKDQDTTSVRLVSLLGSIRARTIGFNWIPAGLSIDALHSDAAHLLLELLPSPPIEGYQVDNQALALMHVLSSPNPRPRELNLSVTIAGARFDESYKHRSLVKMSGTGVRLIFED